MDVDAGLCITAIAMYLTVSRVDIALTNLAANLGYNALRILHISPIGSEIRSIEYL
jgi:acyl dehydratase